MPVASNKTANGATPEARLAAKEEEGKPMTAILTGNAKADAMIQDMTTADEEPWATAVEKTYEANEATFSLPANPADAEFKAAMFDAVNSVLSGDTTPQDALAAAQSEAQEALDDAWAELDSEE